MAASFDGTDYEQELRQRIESLSYLPTTVGVAMKFMALGKDPESEPDDYVKVVQSDSSLSSKLLSLANSAWFGVANKVTKPKVAVNLLGLGTVRTLAISYCLTGLHNELRLSPDESRLFWLASLCRAVAAKRYASHKDAKLGEDAFTAGLFEDLALPLMFSIARDKMLAIIEDRSLDWQQRLQKERDLFHLDHAEVGRILAQRLELPEVFIDTVAFHHNKAGLDEVITNGLLARACHASALFPQVIDGWNTSDAQQLQAFLADNAAEIGADPTTFLQDIQAEFTKLSSFFEEGGSPQLHLVELLEAATKEVANQTTRLVGTVNELMTQAATAGKQVQRFMNA